ncbi:MAG: YiiX family permuted papain-like enzyme [Campylobacteraceae bacterium]|jgi:uncharacterized protein YycO|nr:YiiX family permuted papain-like enzyme [Campylobacteraceae bacterium]
MVKMKKIIFALLTLLSDMFALSDGDIVFQTSLSSQSKAIQLATKSKYSHVGIVFKEAGEYYVFEAVQPVKKTPLNEWIKRGKDGKFVALRLKNDQLSAKTLSKMKKIAASYLGKDYDLTFEWSDDKIYCSEFVWKVYEQGANIKVGKLQKLGDFDLSSKAVKAKLKERFGDNIPLNETVISPAAIFESELLEKVK